jgi:hypothetical protein
MSFWMNVTIFYAVCISALRVFLGVNICSGCFFSWSLLVVNYVFTLMNSIMLLCAIMFTCKTKISWFIWRLYLLAYVNMSTSFSVHCMHSPAIFVPIWDVMQYAKFERSIRIKMFLLNLFLLTIVTYGGQEGKWIQDV